MDKAGLDILKTIKKMVEVNNKLIGVNTKTADTNYNSIIALNDMLGKLNIK